MYCWECAREPMTPSSSFTHPTTRTRQLRNRRKNRAIVARHSQSQAALSELASAPHLDAAHVANSDSNAITENRPHSTLEELIACVPFSPLASSPPASEKLDCETLEDFITLEDFLDCATETQKPAQFSEEEIKEIQFAAEHCILQHSKTIL